MYDFICSMFPVYERRFRSVHAIQRGYLQSTDVYRISESIYDKCATTFYIAGFYMQDESTACTLFN